MPGSKWKLASEELPPDETPVLIVANGKRRLGELRWDRPSFEDAYEAFRYWDSPHDDGQDWDYDGVTHWQYLPEFPEGVVNAE